MLRLPYGYGLDADGTTLICGKVAQRLNKKTGQNEDYLTKVVYPSSIKGAIRHVFRVKTLELVSEHEYDIKTFLKELEALEKQFERFLGNTIKDEIK